MLDIIAAERPNGRTCYTCGERSETHSTDALRRLLRKLVAFGEEGPARVIGLDGRVRMNVSDIGRASRYAASEDSRGLHLRAFRPFPASARPQRPEGAKSSPQRTPRCKHHHPELATA